MKKTVLLLVLAPFMLSGCAVALVGAAGVAVGIAATQEGGISSAVSDAKIQMMINDLWLQYDTETFRKLDLTINQGRVLVTGVVQYPDARVEAIRLAWQPEGVKQVINEVRVADSSGILGFAGDAWITTRLRTKITMDKEILSLNYSIDTVQGTVYLMGVANNQAELDKVIEIASTISGVEQVVSYVKMTGTPIEPVYAPYAPQVDE